MESLNRTGRSSIPRYHSRDSELCRQHSETHVGSSSLSSILPHSCLRRNADAIVIIFAVDSLASFTCAQETLRALRQSGCKSRLLAVFASKLDQTSHRQVSPGEILTLGAQSDILLAQGSCRGKHLGWHLMDYVVRRLCPPDGVVDGNSLPIHSTRRLGAKRGAFGTKG